jgi:hypothetical protein
MPSRRPDKHRARLLAARQQHSPAGEEVWKEYPELRQLILGFVPLLQLPRFMLLGKEYMADVAAVMYHTVGWKQVRNNMSVATVCLSRLDK